MNFSLLDEVFKDKNEPSDLEGIYFLFFDKGISLKEFNELPIPYIMSILKVNKYVKDKESEALKK